MTAELGWLARRWPGVEHVMVASGSAGFRADSEMILSDGGFARIAYHLECRADWQFLSLELSVTKMTGTSRLSLTRDGNGCWVAGQEPLPSLDGCADIDISRTPLTNTLPIRRLPWSPGTARELDVAYISVPELGIRPVKQRYVMLGRDDRTGETEYRYESGAFRADLTIGADGYVADYPGIWRRI
jgi:uncharacterized protein